MSHGYDSGRLNLPFVGIATFGKNTYEPGRSKIDADFAVTGAPFDFGPSSAPERASGHGASAKPRPCFPSAMPGPMILRMT